MTHYLHHCKRVEHMMSFFRFALLLTALYWGCLPSATDFGHNRLQYEQQEWLRYTSENFVLLYAKGDEELARYALPVLELDYIELSRLFEHQLKKKVFVVLYSDFSDYIQSNIGLNRHEVNQGGITQIVTPKMQVYFNGSHEDLRRQIRRGLSEVLLGKILSGTSLQEIVQNSVLMNLPTWFVQGAIAHATENWNTTLDDQLRDIMLSGKYNNFVEFAKKEPYLAGHSLFHYISQEHSPSTVSNLLYLTRINRSVENGFLYVFGKTYYQVVGVDWFNYYRDRYNNDNSKRRFPSKGELELDVSDKATIKQMKLSPNSKHVAYAVHDRGVRKVFIQNVETNEKRMVYRAGERDQTGVYERHYPLLAWNPSSSQLIIVHEKRNMVQIRRQPVDGGKSTEQPLIELERVTGLAVWNSGTLILTGFKEGHSDLYQLKGGQLQALTNDFWDEQEVAVLTLDGKKGLVFSSNRDGAPISSLKFDNAFPSNNFDLYFYDPQAGASSLVRLTNTPVANERAPIAMGKGNHFTYLSDETGFYNRYVAQIDTVLLRKEQILVLEDGTELIRQPDSFYSHLPIDSTYIRSIYIRTGVGYPNTDYSRNIIEHSGNARHIADLLYNKGSYHIFVRNARPEREMETIKKTVYRLLLERKKGLLQRPKTEPAIQPLPLPTPIAPDVETIPQDTAPPPVDTGKIDIDNYEFQSEFQATEPETTEEENIRPMVLIEDGEDIKATERPNAPTKTKLSTTSGTKMVEWNESRSQRHKSLFRVDQLAFQVDNTPLYNNMQMYLGDPYQFVPLSFGFKTRFVDVLEHFHLELGFRIPFDFNGMEYFMNLENRKTLIDQRYSFYRRGRVNNYVLVDTVQNLTQDARGREVKHWFQGEFTYPLSKFQSLRARVGLQLDKVAILADEINTLQVPVYYENRFNLRLEYVFDNSVELYLNAWKGTKFKAYLDFYKPFTLQTENEFRLGLEGGLTTAVGFDARQYFTPDNKTILALRAAAATSFGEQRILYFLGGVENWMFPATNTTVSLPSDVSQYGLRTLAGGLRGFNNNARNGSSYALINAELRVPIIEYLSRTAPRNTILRSLQLVAFFDVGTAWQGASPFSIDNPLNTTVIDPSSPTVTSPVRVVVNYYRRPILMGYGFGIRTVLLGHYFRMDYAWGVETGQVQTPIVHFSVGTDF